MKKKIIKKAVSLNQSIIDEVTLFQDENKCADFSEALRLIITSYFKLIEKEKDENKLNEDIAKIKDILDVMRKVLVNLNDKK